MRGGAVILNITVGVMLSGTRPQANCPRLRVTVAKTQHFPFIFSGTSCVPAPAVVTEGSNINHRRLLIYFIIFWTLYERV